MTKIPYDSVRVDHVSSVYLISLHSCIILRVLMIRNASSLRLSFSYYDHASSSMHWLLSISYLWLDPSTDVCVNDTMKILCEDMHVLALLIFDSSLIRGFWSVSISSLRKKGHKSDIHHSLHDVRYGRILRDENSLFSYSDYLISKTNSCEYVPIFEIVVGMIVKRSISCVYLLSFINQMQFLSSDLISSPSFIIDENIIHFLCYQ